MQLNCILDGEKGLKQGIIETEGGIFLFLKSLAFSWHLDIFVFINSLDYQPY